MPTDMSWVSARKKLIAVAAGRSPADLVIRDGVWVCVQSGELIPHTDIAVVDGHIAYVGPDASLAIGPNTQVIAANGRYLCPGLLDGHMHVESSMLTLTNFVRTVVSHGTTGLFIDPHEIANVFGLNGIRLMVEEATHQPIHVWVQVPSCVPSAPGMETPGASIEPEDISEAMDMQGVIGLGEMMNFPGVSMGDDRMLAEMSVARSAHKVIGGHYASFDLGSSFHSYVAGGAEDDHEVTRAEDAAARIRQGMKAMLRLGSAWQDVVGPIRAITEMGLVSRHVILCTDDCHAETTLTEGHMDRVLRCAIAQGVPPLKAIQMATLNTAEHFGVSNEIGQIAPGRWADILILDSLVAFNVDQVIARGKTIAEHGQRIFDWPDFDYPEWATHSVHLLRPAKPADFLLPGGSQSEAVVNVIGVIENQAPTRCLEEKVNVIGGQIQSDLSRDLAKIAILDRHHASGRVQVGLVHGFGFNKPCAAASTFAHDCHQMIVIGTDDACMARAANLLAEMGGGQIVVQGDEVVGQVSLPLAGLMSALPAAETAAQVATILEGFKKCGCLINNPNMTMSLLGLVVIPELRMSDLGLINVTRFEPTTVVQESNGKNR